MIALIGSQTHQKSATLYGDTGQYILLGGFDKEGRNVENELTHLFWEYSPHFPFLIQN